MTTMKGVINRLRRTTEIHSACLLQKSIPEAKPPPAGRVTVANPDDACENTLALWRKAAKMRSYPAGTRGPQPVLLQDFFNQKRWLLPW